MIKFFHGFAGRHTSAQSALNIHIALHASPRNNSTKISLQTLPSHSCQNFRHNAALKFTIRPKWPVSFFYCTRNSAVQKTAKS